MALTNAGQISMNEMHIEAGGTSGTQVGMNDSDMRSLAGISTGQIAANNFYGKSSSIDVSFNVTVGKSSDTSSPYYGVAIDYTSGQGYGTSYNGASFGTVPSDFDDIGTYVDGVRFTGFTYQAYPNYGTPLVQISFDPDETDPSTIDDLYVSFSDGTNTSGGFPISANQESTYESSFSGRSWGVGQRYIYGSGYQTYHELVSMNFASQSSATPKWNGVATSVNTTWTIRIFEN